MLAALALVTVMSVHDGDTFYTDTHLAVRIAEADAPELAQVYGVQSRDALAALILHKQVDIDCKSMSYKRRVCHVHLGVTDVSAWLIANGHAWLSTKYQTTQSYTLFAAHARAQHRGLWSQPNPVAPWAYRHP